MIRRADILSGALLLVSLLFLAGCSKEWPTHCEEADLQECRVAVVLPLSDGQDADWKQCLGFCTSYLTQAFCNTGLGVRLVFEWYDEQSPDLASTAAELASRDDIKAVIGGLHSDNAIVLAEALSAKDKPFFTLATTDQLVRGYSSWGNLWAMTETDITQCEVMLSKVIQYGAKSVALLVGGESAYGQTFTDWFPFQAQELGIENAGVFSYSNDVEEQTRAALSSDADYILCAPNDVDELEKILKTYNATEHTARLLMSEAAYSGDAIKNLGELAEGIEGVCYSADPTSGFEVAYSALVGRVPVLGEAQVFDAAMLIAFASMMQMLHNGMSFKDAMRELVSGRDKVDSFWGPEGMLRVTKSLTCGGHPDVNGASGSLDFDAKVYTNVLRTFYCNYVIYQQKYVVLEYCSTKGDRRSAPTLAEWNWKNSKMQDIGGGSDIVYPALDRCWALLVATSTGWDNYRHQVDVLNIYQQLKAGGYDDEHIVLVIEDDLADNPSNPEKGVLYSRMDGVNVYKDVKVDYHISDLKPEDLKEILSGHSSARLPEVIKSDSDDNVFVFWSGHGGRGYLKYGKTFFSDLDMDECLTAMEKEGRFRQALWFIETCYSGSVAKMADKHSHTIIFTAAGEDETSKADEYNRNWKVWMSNRFSATLQDCMKSEPDMPLRDLYYRLFQSTVGSHVHVYGIEGYGSLYKHSLEEIL